MNISVIGGDSRILELVKLLTDEENSVFVFGMENAEKLVKVNYVNSVDEALQNSNLVITSIPMSKDGKFFNSTYTDRHISVKEFFKIAKNKKIITGNITEQIKSFIIPENNNNIVDVMKMEELTVLNAIPTAEGAIQIAMEKSLITLHNSKCLILGFGRIGKILAKMLQGIGSKVYCEARKKQDIAWIKSYGYTAIHLDELNSHLNKFDFIFNTIPHLILDKNNLKLVKKDCLIIDLASKPGGVDFDEAKKLNIQTEWELALPGKVAPKTAANFILESGIISDF